MGFEAKDATENHAGGGDQDGFLRCIWDDIWSGHAREGDSRISKDAASKTAQKETEPSAKGALQDSQLKQGLQDKAQQCLDGDTHDTQYHGAEIKVAVAEVLHEVARGEILFKIAREQHLHQESVGMCKTGGRCSNYRQIHCR